MTTQSAKSSPAQQSLDLSNSKIEILEYYRIISKRKKDILELCFGVALVAFIICLAMTPIYTSTSTVMIEGTKSKIVAIQEAYENPLQGREYFQTQVEILKSREVTLIAAKKLKLWDNPLYNPRIVRTDLKTRLKDYLESFESNLGIIKEKPAEIDWDEDSLSEATYPFISKNLKIEPIRLSQLIKISFEHSDANFAATVANTVADSYIENELDMKLKMTQKASDWVQERLAGLNEHLKKAEKDLQEYKEREGLVTTKDDVSSGYGTQMQGINTRLIDAQTKLAEAESAYGQIKEIRRGADLSSLPAVIRNPIVADAVAQLAQSERKVAELVQRYGSEHPKFVQAEGEVVAAKENLQRQINSVAESITREYEVARGIVNTLQANLRRSKGEVQSISRKNFQLTQLEREVDASRGLYDMFVKRAKETSISGDLQAPVARVVEKAVAAKDVSKPKKLQIVAIAAVLALFFGALMALLLDRLDNTVRTSDEVSEKLGKPLLTSLPLLAAADSLRAHVAKLVITEPMSIYSEAIRTARTGILLSVVDEKQRIILISSSVPGEGKTSFSANLALSIAQIKTTLLIDSDMRRPAASRDLGLTGRLKGLSELVSGTAEMSECIHEIPDSPLHFIPCGVAPPSPQELLASERYANTLKILSESYEVIIIDSSPTELVADAMVIAPLVTTIIYVVHAAKTPYQIARKGIHRLQATGANVLGVVLNRLNFKDAEKYHGEYSAYGKHGYGDSALYGSSVKDLAYGSENISANNKT